MTPALVLDGDLKSALAATRALGAQGIPVHVGAARTSAMAKHSRYAQNTFVYASPRASLTDFIASLKSYVDTLDTPVIVYAFSDATHLAVARHLTEFGDTVIFPRPADDAIEQAFDKKKTYELAASLGVPTIKTYSADDLTSVQYPAVVKNSHSVVWPEDSAVTGTAEFVWDYEALNIRYEALAAATGEAPLIQEFITGGEYGVELLVENGTVVRAFAHERIRSLSPTGGAAVVKRTLKRDEVVVNMLSYAKVLARELDWTGPMMVEFKQDERDGSTKLMEINGRFWGSLPLPQAAGVDFVMAYYELATGKVATDESEAKLVTTRHFLGDCKWLMAVWLKRDPLRSTLYPNRFFATFRFIVDCFCCRGDVFSVTDPAPVVWELIDVLKR